jgi:hypothetical protein
MDMLYKSFLPPGLCVLNGKCYVVPGYHEVPMNITLEEVQANWEQKIPEPTPGFHASNEETDAFLEGTWTPEKFNHDLPDIRQTAISSRTHEEYIVERKGGNYSCTCKGFSYRGKCKHIKEIRNKNEFIKN